MTRRRPPRLALALIDRFAADGSSLAGDLAEEFNGGRSRAWVWWQVLAAIALAPLRGSDEIRPLRLVDLQPADAIERARNRSLRFARVNLTASPVYGVGGLGIVALAVLVTAVAPVAWWGLLASIVGGLAIGIARIAVHRRKMQSASPAGRSTIDGSPS